jgi:hypothetical protein
MQIIHGSVVLILDCFVKNRNHLIVATFSFIFCDKQNSLLPGTTELFWYYFVALIPKCFQTQDHLVIAFEWRLLFNMYFVALQRSCVNSISVDLFCIVYKSVQFSK